MAVFVRLETDHRVTDDLDTVASQHGDERTTVIAVIEAEGTDGLLVGTKVDCIAVGDIPAAKLETAQLPDALEDRLFFLSHRWALDTAEELTVVASEEGSGSVRARCRFASPAGLVAMKLQCAPRRRAALAPKAGGDYLDTFRLVSHPALTRPMAMALRRAPHDLGAWRIREVERAMVTEVDRTVGMVIRSGVAEAGVPNADQMRRAGELLLAHYKARS